MQLITQRGGTLVRLVVDVTWDGAGLVEEGAWTGIGLVNEGAWAGVGLVEEGAWTGVGLLMRKAACSGDSWTPVKREIKVSSRF